MEIKGYPNYLIYPDGRVWSKKRKGSSGRFLKPSKDHNGYYRVLLLKDNFRKNDFVHRLVAKNYIPNPDNKPQVDHINRIRTDNRVENLRWVSQKENQQNVGIYTTNKTGHKNIAFRLNKYVVCKRVNGKSTPSKTFKNKIDAICYKYIMLLKIKSNLLK